MKSSSGSHYPTLDHLRAVAAFMVCAWHFTHGFTGHPIPFEGAPKVFPLALLDEGHTGVALFMTLSGYLFSRLLDGKRFSYRAFVWNRVLRLAPLLAFVIGVVGVGKYLAGESLQEYVRLILFGVFAPTLPNGGWSITVEFHFYLLLPLLLMSPSRPTVPLLAVLCGLLLRVCIDSLTGVVEYLAYLSIVGRIDQFALGILAQRFGGALKGRHLTALAVFLAFSLFYWFVDAWGGLVWAFSHPSSSRMWVFIPTIEGLAYASLIAWYDRSFSPRGRLSGLLARVGEATYSIYLLHFFFVFWAAQFVHARVMNISNFYAACLWAALFYVLMIPPAYLSYRVIELPFLRLRRRYVRGAVPVTSPGVSAQRP